MHILVCESEHYIRRALAEHLTSLGYQVSEVENGPQCLDFVSHTVPDLILIDERTAIIKIREKNIQIPVVILSNLEDEEALESEYEYIKKPYQLSQVSSLILAKFGQSGKK